MILLPEVKNYLGVDLLDTTRDVALQELIDRLTATLQKKLDWWFGDPRAATEILDGMGTPRLFLRQPPVLASPEMTLVVWERPNVGGLWTIVPPELYEIEGRRLISVTNWPKGFRNIRVDYFEGFETAPGDVKQLLLQYIESNVVTDSTVLMASEKLGDYSYTAAADATTDIETSPLWKSTFNTYKRLRI